LIKLLKLASLSDSLISKLIDNNYRINDCDHDRFIHISEDINQLDFFKVKINGLIKKVIVSLAKLSNNYYRRDYVVAHIHKLDEASPTKAKLNH
jgi:hypothetical protein